MDIVFVLQPGMCLGLERLSLCSLLGLCMYCIATWAVWKTPCHCRRGAISFLTPFTEIWRYWAARRSGPFIRNPRITLGTA